MREPRLRRSPAFRVARLLRLTAAGLLLLAWAPPALLAAQAAQPPSGSLAAQPPSTEQRIRQQQDELDRLRRERRELEERMNALQRSARSIADEVSNIEAQRSTTQQLVEALDRQLETINEEVIQAGTGLIRAEQELQSKRNVLQRRMIEIYKRGSLYDVEAMLSAQSFAGLVARYRYLHELALRDRGLVRRVEGLRDEIVDQRVRLTRLQGDVSRNRREKDEEARRLADLESRRQRNLTAVQQSALQMRQRVQQLTRDESRIANAIATIETARRRAESAPNARPTAPSSLLTSDLGRLDWPVEGTVLYRFGRVVNPNNTTTRWNGMGIGAAVGTPVRAIAAGSVVLTDNLGTYGPTVIVQHGGGDYSVYGSLARIDVRFGQTVGKGAIIGTVGATDPELPPHLHFEIRPQGRAIDPLSWLRQQR